MLTNLIARPRLTSRRTRTQALTRFRIAEAAYGTSMACALTVAQGAYETIFAPRRFCVRRAIDESGPILRREAMFKGLRSASRWSSRWRLDQRPAPSEFSPDTFTYLVSGPGIAHASCASGSVEEQCQLCKLSPHQPHAQGLPHGRCVQHAIKKARHCQRHDGHRDAGISILKGCVQEDALHRNAQVKLRVARGLFASALSAQKYWQSLIKPRTKNSNG